MNFDFNFHSFITDAVPPHKRDAPRLAWVFLLTSGLKSIYERFKLFLNEIRLEVSIDGSSLSFEYYLDQKIGTTGHQVRPGSSLPRTYIYLQREGRQPLYEGGYIYTQSEYRQDSDFIVETPTTGRTSEIRAYVDKYKLAGLRYEIKEV